MTQGCYREVESPGTDQIQDSFKKCPVDLSSKLELGGSA